jgi:hypothetical protein
LFPRNKNNQKCFIKGPIEQTCQFYNRIEEENPLGKENIAAPPFFWYNYLLEIIEKIVEK